MPSKFVRPETRRVRAPRVPVDLIVESRTIGTSFTYDLMTEDISRSGLLLVWDRDVKMPFIVNTIIEMTIDPKSLCLNKPVNCLGKVVRRQDESDESSVQLGVQIVQIDNTDLCAWEGCLTELEKRFGIEPSNKIMVNAS